MFDPSRPFPIPHEKAVTGIAGRERWTAQIYRNVLHITMPADDDRTALSALVSRLTAEKQMCPRRIPEEANAAQRKYFISRCELIVCCRTHASIAVYSTGVSALVVGCSVKAQGIGKDLRMER